jgi:flagellar hook-associated protein 2
MELVRKFFPSGIDKFRVLLIRTQRATDTCFGFPRTTRKRAQTTMTFGSGIGISGLGSGLDTNSIIRQLVALENIPLQQIQGHKKVEQDKLATLNKFKGFVKTLQDKAKELAKENDFLDFTVTPSQEGVASFSATGAAQAGTHTITALKLAQIDRWAFDGVTDKAANLAGGNGEAVSFTVNGTVYTATMSQADSSLEDIASEINEQAPEDVSATVVNTGTDASPSFKLVLTAKHSGAEARITGITSTVAGLTIDGTAPAPDGTAGSTNNITVGQNALALIDGLQIERTNNDFNDVIEGVDLTLESADPLLEINFSVEADTDAIKTKVKDFVASYNAVMNFANEQNKYSEDEGPGGPLFGDSLLQSVRSAINTAIFSVDLDEVQADTLGYSTMSLLGIKTQSDGTLLVDETKLEEKLTGNLEAFADFFVDHDGFNNGGALPNTPEYYIDTTADSGIAARLDRALERMFTNSAGPNDSSLKGLFESKVETINNKIGRFDDQIDSKQFYLEQYERQLVLKFAKLEEVMGGLNAKGASLQAALNGLI